MIITFVMLHYVKVMFITEEADTERIKFFVCFGSVSLLARGKFLLAFTVLPEVLDDTGKCAFMVE